MKHSLLLLACGLACFTIFCQSSVLAGGSRCSSAEIDRPFRLPNGSVYQPGKLTVCREAEHSPVAFRHTLYVDRMPVGMFSSRREPLEASNSEERYVVLTVEEENLLRFNGIVVPGNERLEMYRFDLRTRVETKDSIRVAAKDEPDESLPQVAPE